MGLILQLLLAFAFALHQSHAQNPPGFISLDCGLRKINGYNDTRTGLFYSNDEDYVDRTSEGKRISPEFIEDTIPRVYLNVRSFPGPQGSRNCYNLRPLHGKGHEVLLRVGFFYGNYDDQKTSPEFDLYVGVSYWRTVKSSSISASIYEAEMIHTPTADYVDVCLVNTGKGTPFVSVIELRSMDPSKPVYNTSSGSLELSTRWNMGTERSSNLVRYEDDPYDRKWEGPWFVNSGQIHISIPNTSRFTQNSFTLPHIIMTTAQEAPSNDSLDFIFSLGNTSDQYSIYLHFAEIVANESREMNAYINDVHLSGPFVPPYFSAFSVFSEPVRHDKLEIKINTTANSKLPAIINALEIFIVKQFSGYETNESDVSAVTSIKATYEITNNWQGDPCSPKKFAWTGISCSYDAFEPPNIISLNLSSSGLNGLIAPSIFNLTMLQSLDLSYNNLTGQVPDFLSWLPSLKFLYLRGNNLTGPLPLALLEKSRNGSLTLSFEIAKDDENSCVNDACKRKNNSTHALVPVVASVASFVTILAFSTLLYIILRRKQKLGKVESNRGNGSRMEPKLRQFTYAEVMSFIGEKKFLGGGGFGSVYLGCMDAVDVAVKLFKVSPEQQTRDFQSEVKILATVYHKNLTRILGYCNEGVNKAIIFELIENGNLNNHLSDTNPNVLSWEQRLAILIGAAEGLEYLHHGCQPPIIHRDIKPENILLTKDFEAKLADFGFSRIFPVQSSRVIGTLGYLDPQYNEPSMLTEKIDIFSFGVVMLVVITGQSAIIRGTTTHIIQWIAPNIKNGDIGGIVDPRFDGNYDVNVCWRIVELAMKCVTSNPSSRPNMNYVVKQLKDCLPSTRTQLDQHDAEITTSPSKISTVVRLPNTM